jgi:hypothetical protein
VTLAGASDNFVAGVDNASAAVSMGSDAVKTLKDYLAVLNSLDTTKGDISAKDMPKVQAALDAATAAWDAAEAQAFRASDLVYEAQANTLSTEITMLDLYSSKARYDEYVKALAFRFPGVELPDYATVVNEAMPAGELACNAWLSYETKAPIRDFAAQERAAGLTCTDLALRRQLLGESLEIAEGLVYEDYIQEPVKL